MSATIKSRPLICDHQFEEIGDNKEIVCVKCKLTIDQLARMQDVLIVRKYDYREVCFEKVKLLPEQRQSNKIESLKAIFELNLEKPELIGYETRVYFEYYYY